MLPSSGSRSDVPGPAASSRGRRYRSNVTTSTTEHVLRIATTIHGLELAILHTLCRTLLFLSAKGAWSPGTKNSRLSVQNSQLWECKYLITRYKVVIGTTITTPIFWNMTSYRVVNSCRRFGVAVYYM